MTASSSYQNDQALLETAFEAFRDEPVTLVASTAAHDPSSFEIPANAYVEKFLPYGRIIPRCACVITHGGMGTAQKALAVGVPVCAVPFMRDQLENARRIEVARAGTRLLPRHLTPARLREAVEAAIQCRDGALRVAEAFARLDPPRAAADALEGLLIEDRQARSSGTPDVSRVG